MADSGGTFKPEKRKRRLRQVKLPGVSGAKSALIVVACLALTAVLIPVTLRLPVWIEFEIVVATWWLVWTGTLTTLLYRGWQLQDDFAPPNLNSPSGARSAGSLLDADGCLCFAPESLSAGLGILLLVILGWIVLELGAPILVFIMYALIYGMLNVVIKDQHHCKDRLGISLGLGIMWATVYSVPLGLAVWLCHVIAARRSA